MLSVGELPTVVRALKEWRKANYKKDPISELLYSEEFSKNRLLEGQIHPQLHDFLRDEAAWQKDQSEFLKLLSQRPQTSYSNRPTPSSPFLSARAIHPSVQQARSAGEAPPPSGSNTSLAEGKSTSTSTSTTKTHSEDASSDQLQDGKKEEVEEEEELSEEEAESVPKEEKSDSKLRTSAEQKGVFKREDVVTTRTHSALTMTLAARKTRETMMELIIYLCCSTGVTASAKMPPMRVRVPETASVDKVLEAVRKKAVEEAIPLNMDPMAYCLRIAEDDGTPDSDAPQLHSEVEVKRFGKFFCIVDNPAFRNVGPTSHRLIKIALGDDQFMTIEIKDKDMKIKDVLWRVCTKSLIDYTQHGLCIINSEEPLPLDMTVLDVQATNLVLVKKGKSRGTARIPNSSRQKSRLGMSTKKQKPALFRSISNTFEKRDTSDDESDEEEPLDPSQAKLSYAFWSDAVAFRHKRYEVMRMSKFGMKQERYIGIDRDRITNTSKKKGADMEGNIQAWKEIKNVVDAVVSDVKPSQFTLTFKEDGKENESYTFEALTAQEACEIVEKIKYCKNNTLHT